MTEKNMQDLIHEEKINYFRQWRANNKDKVKKHNENYWKNRVLKEIQKEKAGENNGK